MQSKTNITEQHLQQNILIENNAGFIFSWVEKLRLQLLLIPVLCITGFFQGCKKNCLEKSTCSLITAVLHTNGDWFHLSYNANGKVNRLLNGTRLTSYEYNGNTTIVTTLDSGRFVTKSTIRLNNLGLVVNVRTDKNAAGTSWFSTAYEYNGEELAKSTITLSDGGSPMITTYTWVNQNLVSITSGTVTNDFGYYMDKPSQDADYLGLLQLFQGYQIYKNRNLLKTISTAGLSYQFRTDGNISSASVTSGNNINILDYKVIYECN